MKSRVRITAVLLTAVAVTLVGFQNCSDMKANVANSSSSFRMGRNGEKITEFQPTSMFTGGGSLTVLGENLTENTEVNIDGAACLEKVFVSVNEIRCRVPALISGGKNVEVAGASMPVKLTFVDFSKVNSVAGRNGIGGTLDGVGRLARITAIGGMASDGEKLYFTESKNNMVRSLDLNTFETKTIAGTSTPGRGAFADGIGPAARFDSPTGIAVKGNFVFVSDQDNCVIRKIDLTSNAVSVLVGTARASASDPCPVVDGAVGVAQVGRPNALLIDGNFLYVGEKAPGGSGVIRRVDLTSLSITTVAGVIGLETADMPMPDAWVHSAESLTQARTLATALETAHPTLATGIDEYQHTVSQPGAVAMRLHFTQVALNEYDQLRIDNINGDTLFTLSDLSRSDFWTPVLMTNEVTIDSYFYDGTYGFKIDKIEYTTDATGTRIHSYDGAALEMPLGSPAAMVKIGDEIYFTDGDLNMVRKVNLISKKLTGVTGVMDLGDRKLGTFWETAFAGPMGLAADSRYLYIADLGDGPLIGKTGERIIKMDLVTRESSVLVQSDPAAGNPSNIDGPLANAAIMQPRYMHYDPKRGLFFDCFDVIRRIK